MVLTTVYLFPVFLSIASPDEIPFARTLVNTSSVCDSATAVTPAAEAYDQEDYEEIARLGCRFAVPEKLKAIALRCEPSYLDYKSKNFSYPIVQDVTLPEGICEIEVFLPNGWKAILYTHVRNFAWWD